MIASRHDRRVKRQYRNRKNISGTTLRPRLVVFASNENISAQVIDDTKDLTIVSVSTVGGSIEGKRGTEKAFNVGVAIAKKALEANVKAVVFDRAGFAYHGRVKALAQGAREGGLDF